MMRKLALALAMFTVVPAHAGALETLINNYSQERLCGTHFDPAEMRALVRELEAQGMTFIQIQDRVVTEGKRLADRIEWSGDKEWVCKRGG